jgi:hypothetical protein
MLTAGRSAIFERPGEMPAKLQTWLGNRHRKKEQEGRADHEDRTLRIPHDFRRTAPATTSMPYGLALATVVRLAFR